MIYVLYGLENYLITKQRQTIIHGFVQDLDMNVTYFDAQKQSMVEIINDAQTTPFFADYKCVVVQNCKFLSGASSAGVQIDVLERYLVNENPTTILILELIHDKLDARKTIVKKLKKQVQVMEFNTLSDVERKRFIHEEIRKRQLQLDASALQECYYRLNGSLAQTIQELDKLATYNQILSKQDIESLVRRPLEDNVFDLFNALIDQKFTQVYQLWKDFDSQNQEVIALIALLANQYRFLKQVKVLQHERYSKQEIIKLLGAHPFRVEKTMAMCHKIKLKELNLILFDLAQLDQQIKMGKIDKKLGFELFLIAKGNL